MENLQKEQDFFKHIVPKIIDFVSQNAEDLSIVEHKGEGDFATHVDVGVEKLIVEDIGKRFPGDAILAEEGHSTTQFAGKRTWIIDPICGTNNLGRGIKNFCTNIALTESTKLIASCVIDHSHNEFFWSTGNNTLYRNDKPFQKLDSTFDTIIEVDFGSTISLDLQQKDKHNRFLKKMITETNYYIISLNSSLSFAYTALGRVDGFVNMYNHPWDIAAASFLMQQTGGVITDLTGKPWTLQSVGAIGGKNKEIHQKILQIFLSC